MSKAAKVKNKIIRGTFGSVWINNTPCYEVKSVEATVTLNYEELHLNGAFGTYRRYQGYDVSGTVVLHKIDSKIPRLMGSGPKTGELPYIKMDTLITDPDVNGAQRAVMDDVTLDELMLAQFENNTLVEESVPFHASGYDMPEWLETVFGGTVA